MNLLLISAIILFASALCLMWTARVLRKTSGIPNGKIIYTDVGDWRKIEDSLFDPVLRLAGRPDYVVESRYGILPVEVKSSRAVVDPYDGHVLQLAAYFRLIEAVYKVKPRVGYINYPDKTFEINNSKELEKSLETELEHIRSDMHALTWENSEINRSHQSPFRCRSCGYREICTQVLR